MFLIFVEIASAISGKTAMNTRQSGSEGVVAKMGDPTPAGSQDPGGDGEVSRQIPNYRLVLSSGSDAYLDPYGPRCKPRRG